MQTYADGIKNKLQDWVTSGGARSAGESIGSAVADGIKAIADLGKWIADSLTEKGGGNMIKGAIETAVDWIGLGASAVSEFVSGFVGGLSPIGASIYNTIIDAVSGALNMMPYGVGEGLAETLQSSKMEVDWSKKSYSTPSGSGSKSSSYGGGGSYANYDTSRYNIGKSGDVYYLYDKQAQNASGSYTATVGSYSSKKAAEEAAQALTEGAKEAATVDTRTAQSNAVTSNTATKKSTDEIYKATQNYKTTSDSVNTSTLSTYSWINNSLRSTSSTMSSDLKIGSGAILEAGRVSFNWATSFQTWILLSRSRRRFHR